MNYKTKNTNPLDYKVVDGGRVRFATWPCSEVWNCPFSASEIEQAWDDLHVRRKKLEKDAYVSLMNPQWVAIFKGKELKEVFAAALEMTKKTEGVAPEFWVERQNDYTLERVIAGTYDPEADAREIQEFFLQ